MTKQKIIFVSKGLNIGGVERALVALVNNLCHTYDISVILLDNRNAVLESEIDEKVSILYLNKASFNYMLADKENKEHLNCKLILYKAFIRFIGKIGLKKKFEKKIYKNCGEFLCDYAISYAGYPGPWDTVSVLIQSKMKIAYVHNNPYALGINKMDINNYYGDFDKVLCVSKDIQSKLVEISESIRKKTCVAYNLIDKDKINSLSNCESPYGEKKMKVIVTVARLENRSKRFDRIIKTVQVMLDNKFSDFIWYIVGDGEDKNKVMEWILEKHLEKYIRIEGFQSNPYKYIKNADIFILASDYEGLPITLMETEYLCVPMIVTDFSCASEIVKNGINGFIVGKRAEEIAKCIMNILDNEEEYKNIKNNLSMRKDLNLGGDFSFETAIEERTTT